jgi:hypothetical protein
MLGFFGADVAAGIKAIVEKWSASFPSSRTCRTTQGYQDTARVALPSVRRNTL